MRYLVIAAALALAACGEKPVPTPEEEIQGLWYTDVAGTSCGKGVSFSGNAYTVVDVCTLTNGQDAMQMEVGTFTLLAGVLTTTPAKATCGDVKQEMVNYKINGSALTIIAPDGLLIMQRQSAQGGDGSGGAAKFVCFTKDGAVPAELKLVN